MKVVGHDPVVLDVTTDEAVRLAYVSMMLLSMDPAAPCVPSHWFCAAVEKVPDKKLAALYDGKGKGEKWFVRASRQVFRAMAWCPDVDESGFSSDELEDWVEAALSHADLNEESVRAVHALGLALGGKPRLDA